MPQKMMSPALRARDYYKVEVAGAQVGWSRSESYRRREDGDIPAERYGKLWLVPRRKWDRKIRSHLKHNGK